MPLPRRRAVRRNPHQPDLQAALNSVAPDVAEAAREASERLRQAGIRHVLIGGLAVGAHGYHRATKDVDFLLGPEGFIYHGKLLTYRPEVPLRYGNVAIDSLEEPVLASRFAVLPKPGEVPVLPVEALVAMKLVAWRPRDRNDVQELYARGAFVRPDVVAFLDDITRPDLIERLDYLITTGPG